MNADTAHIDDLQRAGCWRRLWATLIDWIVMVFAFQVVAVILFAATAGWVQMNSGFFSSCAPVTTIPQTLDPPPPHDSNYAQVCEVKFFGAITGAVLVVGRVTREGNMTTDVHRGYMLGKDGTPIHGTSIDDIVWLAYLAYLIGMIWKTGKTLGARIVKVRVVDVTRPGTPGVSLRKTIIRYLVMSIGIVPALAVTVYQRIAVGDDAEAMFTAPFFNWYMAAGGLGLIWLFTLIVQIANRTDPFYDRLAGTAVLRDTKPR
jgi:uncharacterized RDD family membrane protein YckC